MLKQKLNKELLLNISLISQLGSTMIGSILIIFFIFLFLDKKFQTNGILLLVGILLGVILGLFSSYRLLKKFYEKTK